MPADILATLDAERHIRRLIARYGEAVAHRDAERARALFAEDAEVTIADMPVRVGRDAVVGGFANTLSRFRWLHQQSDSGVIEVDGDSAYATCQVVEFNESLADGTVAMITGTYADSYVRRQGVWYFHRRHFTLRARAVIGAAHQQ